MISWGWVVIALFVGIGIGLFWAAAAEISRREDERSDRHDRRQ